MLRTLETTRERAVSDVSRASSTEVATRFSVFTLCRFIATVCCSQFLYKQRLCGFLFSEPVQEHSEEVYKMFPSWWPEAHCYSPMLNFNCTKQTRTRPYTLGTDPKQLLHTVAFQFLYCFSNDRVTITLSVNAISIKLEVPATMWACLHNHKQEQIVAMVQWLCHINMYKKRSSVHIKQ